jgi:V/A-type H+-transporting ATPase subunit K
MSVRKTVLVFLVLLFVVGTVGLLGAQTETQAAKEPKSGLTVALLAIAASFSVGITAIGTGIAQSRIGAAGAGTIAEKPESAGTIVLLVAIPETMVILGFVVAIVILFAL